MSFKLRCLWAMRKIIVYISTFKHHIPLYLFRLAKTVVILAHVKLDTLEGTVKSMLVSKNAEKHRA